MLNGWCTAGHLSQSGTVPPNNMCVSSSGISMPISRRTQASPGNSRRLALRAQFDRIFRRRTGFTTLDRLLARLHANKAELLMVLDRPDTPLHTNGSENDIRCQVTRRKISAGTRSDNGRACRDAFLGLAKTCTKLGVAFWVYHGRRLQIPGTCIVPYLPGLVRCRGANDLIAPAARGFPPILRLQVTRGKTPGADAFFRLRRL